MRSCPGLYSFSFFAAEFPGPRLVAKKTSSSSDSVSLCPSQLLHYAFSDSWTVFSGINVSCARHWGSFSDTLPVCPVQVINLSPNAPTELESSPAYTQNSFIRVGCSFLPSYLGDVRFHSIIRGLKHYYYYFRGRVLSISG